MKKIRINEALCHGKDLMLSECGSYYTNGHWLINVECAQLMKSAPPIKNRCLDVLPILAEYLKEDYKIAAVSNIHLNGATALIVDSAIEAWVDVHYAEVLLSDNMICVRGQWDPIFVRGVVNDYIVTTSVLMPKRMDIYGCDKDMLQAWMGALR